MRRLGYTTGSPPVMPHDEIAYLFLLAHETGMRQGEIHGLTRDRINLKANPPHQPQDLRDRGRQDHSNPAQGHQGAVGARGQCRRQDGRPFRSSQASVDTLFRRYRDQCMVKDLTFHDSRATALTLLARRLDIMVLCRISGHVDPSMILKRYYRERPEAIAARI